MSTEGVIFGVIFCVFGAIVLAIAMHAMPSVVRWLRARRATRDGTFSDPGITIEVDCRKCGQFNRVPSHRLRDRPKCGRCKEHLMPGRRVVFCRTYPMDGVMRAELDALWKDEDRLWQCLADHAAIKAKAVAEAHDPQRKVVN